MITLRYRIMALTKEATPEVDDIEEFHEARNSFLSYPVLSTLIILGLLKQLELPVVSGYKSQEKFRTDFVFWLDQQNSTRKVLQHLILFVNQVSIICNDLKANYANFDLNPYKHLNTAVPKNKRALYLFKTDHSFIGVLFHFQELDLVRLWNMVSTIETFKTQENTYRASPAFITALKGLYKKLTWTFLVPSLDATVNNDMLKHVQELFNLNTETWPNSSKNVNVIAYSTHNPLHFIYEVYGLINPTHFKTLSLK